MRVLLVNKFYYRRGGDCIYMLNVEHLLKSHGHEVAVYAMDYPENIPSEWSGYWPKNMSRIDALTRPFGCRQVKKGFTRILDDFKPDVVHLNNIHTQISPVIAEIAHKKGVKVVWTIHDYKLLCPRYDCLQNSKKICEECYTDKKGVLRHGCMKNSKAASIIAYMEAKKWCKEKLETYTDVFICPSRFMAEKMAKGGYDEKKLKVLCNFIDIEKCKNNLYEKREYYCYIGRLSNEKGIKTLLEAAKQLALKLIVIGGGPLEKELKAKSYKNVEFVGFKQWNDIIKLVSRAKFSVLPSEWYENNPLTVIEAECLGTPVLGARIGGIPELIEEGVTGMTFESGNIAALKKKIETMWNSKFDYQMVSELSLERYCSENYYKEIMKIYQ